MSGMELPELVPIEYRGQAGIEREIGLIKAALGDVPASDAFLTTTAPASIEAGRVNEFYASEAWHTADDLAEMARLSSDEFKAKYPELPMDAVRTLAWGCTFDCK